MALVLEEFVISLGLDSRNLSDGEKAVIAQLDRLRETMQKVADAFNSGEKESSKSLKKTRENASKTGKELEKSGKQAASFFSGMRKEILALAGVTLTLSTINNKLKETSNSLMGLGTSAKAFGMTAKQVDGLGRTFEQGGATKEEATSLLSRISGSKSQLISGLGFDDFAEELYTLAAMNGGRIDLVNGSTEDAMRELSKMFNGMSQEQRQTWGKRLGLTDYATQVLSDDQFGSKLDQNIASSNATEEAIESNRRFVAEMAKFKQSIDSLYQSVMTALLPWFEKFAKWLQEVADWFAQNPEKIQEAIDTFMKGVMNVAEWASKAADAVGGWENAALALVAVGLSGWFTSLIGLATSLSKIALPAAVGLAAYEAATWAIENTETGKWAYDKLTGLVEWATGETAASEARMREDEEIYRRAIERRDAAKLQGQVSNTQSTHSTPIKSWESTPRNQRASVGRQNLDAMTPIFNQIEQQYRLPRGWLRSVATKESSGFPDAVSPAGAKGMFQFMPKTAEEMGLIGDDVFDPVKSAWAAGKYFRQLANAHNNDMHETLAAYNWGTGNVKRYGMDRAPAETRNYVDSVSTLMGAPTRYAGNTDNSREININGPISITSNANNVKDLTQDIQQSVSPQIVIAYASGVND